MANKLRGEVLLQLDDERLYLLRPTFNAICNIETELKKSILLVLANITQKSLTAREQVVIIKNTLILDGNRTRPTDKEIFEFIQEYGLVKLFRKLIRLLIMAVGIDTKAVEKAIS